MSTNASSRCGTSLAAMVTHLHLLHWTVYCFVARTPLYWTGNGGNLIMASRLSKLDVFKAWVACTKGIRICHGIDVHFRILSLHVSLTCGS